MGEGGEPLWPPGFVGSISHTRTHAGAFVARKSEYQSVGLDLDDGRTVGEAAATDLMTPEEVERTIAAGFGSDRSSAERFVFAAKEAVFKCQYPLTGDADLDFLDVELELGDASGTTATMIATWRAPNRPQPGAQIRAFPILFHYLTDVRVVVATSARRDCV